jgi:ankyrin repeat protein
VETAETLALLAQRGDLNGVKRRLKTGANPNNEAEFLGGVPPLQWAASNGHAAVVEVLVAAKAKPPNGITSSTMLNEKSLQGDERALLRWVLREMDAELRAVLPAPPSLETASPAEL